MSNGSYEKAQCTTPAHGSIESSIMYINQNIESFMQDFPAQVVQCMEGRVKLEQLQKSTFNSLFVTSSTTQAMRV